MAANMEEPFVPLEGAENTRTSYTGRLWRFAKISLMVMGVLGVVAVAVHISSSQQPDPEAITVAEYHGRGPPPAKKHKEVAASPSQMAKVTSIRAFNDLLTDTAMTDAKAAYDAMPHHHLELLFKDFLATIKSQAPDDSGFMRATKTGKYSSHKEHQHRFAVFKETILTVMKQNADEYARNKDTNRARYGITIHADWTYEEFRRIRLNKPKKGINYDADNSTVIPEPMDLGITCDQSYSGPVRDQGQCGSCWAHAAAQQLRYQTFAMTRQDPGFMSVQFLIDCFPRSGVIANTRFNFGERCSDGVKGCCGGVAWLADAWLANIGGLPSMQQYGPQVSAQHPFTAYPCHNSARKVLPRTPIYQYRSEEQIANALCSKGPLTIAIYGEGVQHYMGGIMNSAGCPARQTDHEVLYTGIDRTFDNGNPVHIILNSWGNDWGVASQRPYSSNAASKGHILFKFGQNVCNLRDDARQPNSVQLLR